MQGLGFESTGTTANPPAGYVDWDSYQAALDAYAAEQAKNAAGGTTAASGTLIKGVKNEYLVLGVLGVIAVMVVMQR